MKQLSSKQCKLIMLFYVCLNKIMLLPSLICSNLTNNFWVCLMIMFLIEFMFILMILNINKDNPDLTIKQRMKNAFGEHFTRIFYMFLGILLLIKAVFAVHECYIFLFDALYTNYKWIEMLIPLTIYLFYVGMKDFTNFGRTIEIIRFIIYGCIGVALFDALPNLNALSMLPIITTTAPRVVSTSFYYMLWFGDFLLLFFMVGDIKLDKKMHTKILSGWLTGVLITMIVMLFFYMTYGILSPLKRMALIDITQFVPKLSNSSNFSWLVTTSWTIPIFFNLGLIVYLVCQSFAITFKVKQSNRKILSFIVVAMIVGILTLFNFSLNNLIDFLIGGFDIYVLIVQYVLPLLILPICVLKCKKPAKRQVKYAK